MLKLCKQLKERVYSKELSMEIYPQIIQIVELAKNLKERLVTRLVKKKEMRKQCTIRYGTEVIKMQSI